MIILSLDRLRLRLLGQTKSNSNTQDSTRFDQKEFGSIKLLLCAVVHGALLILLCLGIVKLITWL